MKLSSWLTNYNKNRNLSFFGRSNVLNQLRLILTETENGIAQTVFIKGEAGIGKTRLVGAIASELQEKQWNVIKGDGQSFDEGISLAPIIQAFRMALDRLTEEEREEVASKFQYLNVLFPDLNGPLPVPLQHPDIERTRMFENFRLFTLYLANKSSLLFWLDDIPDADSETLDWLQYCIKHTTNANIAFIGTYRTSTIPGSQSLQKLETYLTRHQLLQTIMLEPLSRTDSTELANAELDGKVNEKTIKLINDRTLGVPLYIIELIRNLKASGGLILNNGIWELEESAKERIPHNISVLLEQRLQSLTKEEWNLLPLFLASNDMLPWIVLKEVSNMNQIDLIKHVQGLIEKGLIKEEVIELNISYKFLHPMLKDVCKAKINHISLQQAHIQLSKAWQEKDVLKSAFHILSTGNLLDEGLSSEILYKAGKRYLSLGSFSTAKEYLIKANQSITNNSIDEDKELKWHIQLALSEALTNTGELEHALHLLNDLYFHNQEIHKKIRVKRWMAWVEVNRSFEEAKRHLKEGLVLWNGAEENGDILWLLNEQIINELNIGSIGEAEGLLRKLQAYVETFYSPRAELLYIIRKAHVALMNWKKPSITLEDVNLILEKAYQIGEPELIYDVYCLFGYIALNEGDYKTSIRFTKECTAIMRKNGMVIHEISLRLVGMCGLFMRGDWEEAYKEAKATELMAREFEVNAAVVCTLDLRGLILTAQGKIKEGELVLQELDRLIPVVFPHGGPYESDEALHIVRAVQYLTQGKATNYVQKAKTVYWTNSHGMQTFIKLIEGILLIRAGLDEAAIELRNQLKQAISEKQPNYIEGIIELLGGLHEIIKGSNETALPKIQKALNIFKALNLPLEQGLGNAYLADIFEGSNKEKALELSVYYFQKINAYGLVEWIKQKHSAKLQGNQHIHEVKLKKEQQPEPMVETLTNRELEILYTLAEGCSNKEIAENFRLTVGTVKIHLNNLYGKLGVNRRVQAVNRARELNLIS